MRFLITGALGFIGRQVVQCALNDGHEVVALVRSQPTSNIFKNDPNIQFVEFEIGTSTLDLSIFNCRIDAVVHLAWSKLADCNHLSHLNTQLLNHMGFLEKCIERGIPKVFVAGTCLEYGSKSTGEMKPDSTPSPDCSYAMAKNELREQLEQLQSHVPFHLLWARLFYIYGPGSRLGGLFGQLERAILRGDDSFPMTGGLQERDYLEVSKVAEAILDLVVKNHDSALVNICSGRPTEIRHMVESYIKDRGAAIVPKYGEIPYSDHEPFSFWGQPYANSINIGKTRA